MKFPLICQILTYQLLIVSILYVQSSGALSIDVAKLKKYVVSRPNNQIRIEPHTDESFDYNEYKNETIFSSEKIPVKYWKNQKKEALQLRIENEVKYSANAGIVASTDVFRFYNQLNTNEQQIYDIIYNGSSKPYPDVEIKVVISGITDVYSFIDELIISAEKIFTVLSYENPELWWIGTYQFVIVSTQTQNQYVISFLTIPEDSTFYGYDNKDLFKINQEVDEAKNKLVNEIRGLNITTPYSILRYLHDYFITNIVYTLDDSRKHIRTLYGALVENKCVCEGYAEAFQYIAKQFDINCIVARSSSHEWNFVELNNKWYVVDLTYDDPMINGENTPSGSNANLKLDYFLIGTEDKVSANTKYSEEPNHILIFSGFSDKEMVSYPIIEKKAYSPTELDLEQLFTLSLSVPPSGSNILFINDPQYKDKNYSNDALSIKKLSIITSYHFIITLVILFFLI